MFKTPARKLFVSTQRKAWAAYEAEQARLNPRPTVQEPPKPKTDFEIYQDMVRKLACDTLCGFDRVTINVGLSSIKVQIG